MQGRKSDPVLWCRLEDLSNEHISKRKSFLFFIWHYNMVPCAQTNMLKIKRVSLSLPRNSIFYTRSNVFSVYRDTFRSIIIPCWACVPHAQVMKSDKNHQKKQIKTSEKCLRWSCLLLRPWKPIFAISYLQCVLCKQNIFSQSWKGFGYFRWEIWMHQSGFSNIWTKMLWGLWGSFVYVVKLLSIKSDHTHTIQTILGFESWILKNNIFRLQLWFMFC